MSHASGRQLGARLISSVQASSRCKCPLRISSPLVRRRGASPSLQSASTPRPLYTQTRPQKQTTPTPASKPTSSTSISADPELRSLTDGLDDPPPVLNPNEKQVDWARSFHGLSHEKFPKDVAETLLQEVKETDVEIKPDGIIYLPEIKYRRILNKAFGPGGWGLAPRGETIVTGKLVTREYAMIANGRLVSIARGEQQYFDPEGIPTATEGCKSNALMRCCKDLGIASELWDPRYVKAWLEKHAKDTWVEHVVSKKRRKIWVRKDDGVKYPYKEVVSGQK
ncbi:MAG: hypothetical protein M1820_005575 [Bogoriella megaspora]|nr:MAG: hypothetical protein M1820_005575 [Bogoriella megaspora]